MEKAIPDAEVTGYQGLIPSLNLPDPDDRHVLAAAIVGRADVIVTLNLRDFPGSQLQLLGIEPQHPDVFIRHVLDVDLPVTLTAVKAHREALKRPALAPSDSLAMLGRQGLIETVTFLRRWNGLMRPGGRLVDAHGATTGRDRPGLAASKSAKSSPKQTLPSGCTSSRARHSAGGGLLWCSSIRLPSQYATLAGTFACPAAQRRTNRSLHPSRSARSRCDQCSESRISRSRVGDTRSLPRGQAGA